MKNMLRAELGKLKHSKIWLAVALLPFLSVTLGTFNYAQNTEVLTQEWYSLWTQVCLFYNYIFFPVLIAVICAYLCRLEYLGDNWALSFSSPVKISHIYFSKFAVCGILTFLIQFSLFVFYIFAGFSQGLGSGPPIITLYWVCKGWLASLAIISLQLLFSIVIKSFAIPIGLSLFGGVSGLILLTQNLGLLSPYSLLSIGMNAAEPVNELSNIIKIGFYLSIIIFTMLFVSLGTRYLKQRKVF